MIHEKLPHPTFWRDKQSYCIIVNWCTDMGSTLGEGMAVHSDLDLARCLWDIVIFASQKPESFWYFKFAVSAWDNASSFNSRGDSSMSFALGFRYRSP